MTDPATLGELLVRREVLDRQALDAALEEQSRSGKRLGEILVEMGLLSEEAIRWALAEQMDLPLVHPDAEALDPEALQRLPADLCRRYAVLPLSLSREVGATEPTLTLAAADPARRDVMEEISRRAGCPLQVVAALREDIQAVLSKVYGRGPADDLDIRSGNLPPDAASAVMEDPTGSLLLGHLLSGVLERGEGGLHLRLRDDEVIVDDLRSRVLFTGGATWHIILLDRLRQLAEMGEATGTIVQRGRFLFSRPGDPRASLFRVSILRGVEGEEAQVKLIRWEGEGQTLAEFGFTAQQALTLRKALAKPGLVWVTSPAEAGLGSTLFALLREVPDRGKTLTVEEEVCYRSPGFLQLETLGVAEGGRGDVLRELKYTDFGRILIDRVSPARLDGLLALALRKRWVLAASAEANLKETLAVFARRATELPLYGLRLVVHQRLVSLLCPSCRKACALGTVEQQALANLLPSHTQVYQEGEGCARCAGRGTAGWKAFFEVLPVDVSAREALYAEARGDHGIDMLLSQVKPTIRDQVGEAVARGEVSLSELWDVV